MKVLILDDNSSFQRFLALELPEQFWGEKIEVLGAFSICEAEDLFGRNPDVDIIAVDACVPGTDINTVPFVRKVRARGYVGPMVAMSSYSENRVLLRRAGCDYESEKEFLVQRIKDILAVRQPVAV
jgi:DNA-binding response OmpR family regulator